MKEKSKREPFFLCDIVGLCTQRSKCKEGFVPRAWYAELEHGCFGGHIALRGYCNVGERMPKVTYQVPLDDGLTGDALLAELYRQMEILRPFEERLSEGCYTGRIWSRGQWYARQDSMDERAKQQQFIDLFPVGHRPAARRWLGKNHPLPQDGRHGLRESVGELFCAVVEAARESGDMAEADTILDYILPGPQECYSDAEEERKIMDYQFGFLPCIIRGGSEGVYIDFLLRGVFDASGKREQIRIGTLKTLREDQEGYRIMGALGGILLYHANHYVNAHLDRFTPEKELNGA